MTRTVDLIVTRHPALVEYLVEIGVADEGTCVLEHATEGQVAGCHVAGVLPHSLSCHCASYTEVPLRLPAELRGQELSLEQVREFAREPVCYQVRAEGGHCGFCGSLDVERSGFEAMYGTRVYTLNCHDCGRTEVLRTE